MAVSCQAFTDFLSRRAEHLDDEILRDITPGASLIGHFETGRFPAQDGVSHTFDKFNRVFPDLSSAWTDVSIGNCVGNPCDPSETKIGLGFTRDMYKLQEKHYATDLFCFDAILSADRAKQQYAHIVENLRDATNIIISDRLRTELFRIATFKWSCLTGGTPLAAFTFTETGNLINVLPSVMPTSKLVVNMLRRRVQNQILQGATGKVPMNMPPEIEVLADMEYIWDLIEGDTTLSDRWRFSAFEPSAKEYYQYGWAGRVGNFMLHADLTPLRFQIANDGVTLNRVFPYVNVAATQGIRGIVNPAYLTAPVTAVFIKHRRAMRNLVRDTTSIHPMMPFAARDFGGKWKFAMDNLTCGTANATDPTTGAAITIPIAVDNTRRNKGKFISDFEFATQAMFPEYLEVFLCLREPACTVGVAPCASTPAYVVQDYSSANDPCE